MYHPLASSSSRFGDCNGATSPALLILDIMIRGIRKTVIPGRDRGIGLGRQGNISFRATLCQYDLYPN